MRGVCEPEGFAIIPRDPPWGFPVWTGPTLIMAGDGGVPNVWDCLGNRESAENVAAVVSQATWGTEEMEPEYWRLESVEGSTQEAEATALLIQLSEIRAQAEINYL